MKKLLITVLLILSTIITGDVIATPGEIQLEKSCLNIMKPLCYGGRVFCVCTATECNYICITK